MIMSAEQAQTYTGSAGQKAFVELGFDSMYYLRTIEDKATGATASVLYSGLGLPVSYFATANEAHAWAMQSGFEILPRH